MTTPPRRVVLLWGAGAAAAPAFARPAATDEPRAGAFFSAAQAALMAAMVDRLLPADDHPSASQAGVVTYIDRQLAGLFGRGARMYLEAPFSRGTPQQGYQLPLTPAQLYRESLLALMADTTWRDFAALDPDRQDALLERLEAGAFMLGRVPSAVFFETLLANTIEGYFADPMYGGNRDMAGWRMIGFPGAYANFAQWVGRHGIALDREPMSIAMQMQSARDHAGHAGPESRR